MSAIAPIDLSDSSDLSDLSDHSNAASDLSDYRELSVQPCERAYFHFAPLPGARTLPCPLSLTGTAFFFTLDNMVPCFAPSGTSTVCEGS